MLRVSTKGLSELATRLEQAQRNMPKLQARFMSTVQRGARTETTRAATKVYGATQRRIGEGLAVSPVNAATLSFVVTGSRKPISLVQYGARGSKRSGVSVQVLRGQRHRLASAFLAESPQGARLAWQRVGRARLPIKPLFGPSVADMLANTLVSQPLADRFLERARNELTRLIRAALGG